MDINRTILSGRCTRQPELKQTNGNDWCFLSIAVNEYDFKTKKPVTQFVSVMVGGKLAAIVCDKVDKGSVVLVEAKVKVRKGDPEKGTKDSLGLSAENVVFTSAPKMQGEGDETSEELI